MPTQPHLVVSYHPLLEVLGGRPVLDLEHRLAGCMLILVCLEELGLRGKDWQQDANDCFWPIPPSGGQRLQIDRVRTPVIRFAKL